MAFLHPMVKCEMGDGGESLVESNPHVTVSGIAAGGVGDVGKRDRVPSCGLEEGKTLKKSKQGFVPPRGFLGQLLKQPEVFAPMPLSMRPIAPMSSTSKMESNFNLRPLAPLSTARPMMPLSMVRPVASPSTAMPIESPPISTVWPEAQPSLPVQVMATEEGNGSRQFWKAGDYEGPAESSSSLLVDIDHVRVHPKFLHSNATSHKWALGALAELLDNSMDVCNGATFVSIDVLENPKDQTKMLLVEDNGGGMDPDRMRQCLSLGYSMKSKSANTIGQYGNGFKTSTMRLGADVIVFSRCKGKDGMSPTQSIGMLSYTFLRNTGKQDIIVPMVDYERRDDDWHEMGRSSSVAWKTNMDSIVQWSPYSSEADLLQQFNYMCDQGTRIIIYNLWEDDEGQLELDFVTDSQDIQIRGANRDEKKIEMSVKCPNSRHFLTYHHSLRSYASILYLRLPQGFRMILRGKEIDHHNIVNDMMITEEKTYRPQVGPDGVPKDPNIFAVVTIGFVKDAINHVDVQGFNVYHKNRLIKPFWRVWNAAGSNGRGIIGVLEANFIEPAHDKQGFERTTVLSRLEARLLRIQKAYWSSNCHKIGYAPQRPKKSMSNSVDNESSPEASQKRCTTPTKTNTPSVVQSQDSIKSQNFGNLSLHSNYDARESTASAKSDELRNHELMNSSKNSQNNDSEKSGESASFHQLRDLSSSGNCCGSGPSGAECIPTKKSLDGSEEAACSSILSPPVLNDGLRQSHVFARSETKNIPLFRSCSKDWDMHTKLLTYENKFLKERMIKIEVKLLNDLKISREKNKVLAEKIEFLEKRLKDADKEQETMLNVFLEERQRRDAEEEEWRNKLKVANDTIKNLENCAIGGVKSEPQ